MVDCMPRQGEIARLRRSLLRRRSSLDEVNQPHDARVLAAMRFFGSQGFLFATAGGAAVTGSAALVTSVELWRTEDPVWLGAVIANTIGFCIAMATWQWTRRYGMSRGPVLMVLSLMATVPAIAIAVASTVNPDIPAAYVFSAMMWWLPYNVVVAGLYIDERVTNVVAVLCAVVFLGLFATSQGQLSAIEGPPAIVAVLGSWVNGVFIFLCILGMGFLYGRLGNVDREIIVRLIREEDEKHRMAVQEREQERARTVAEEANRAKSAFLSSMSHELRTPLNAINGYTQLLARRTDLAPEIQASLRIMRTSGDHLLTLIDDVLDLAKIEAGHLEFRSDVVDLPSVIASVVDQMRPAAEAGSAALQSQVDPAAGAVMGDERRLRQVLSALIGHAVERAPGGTVDVHVAPADPSRPPQWRFEIRTATTTPPSEPTVEEVGPGLELSISRRLLEGMGSDLSMEQIWGQGWVLSFELALAPIEVRKHQPAQAAGAEQWEIPSDDVLVHLHQLATIGNLVRLRKEIATLTTEAPKQASFLGEVDFHARVFDDRAVLELLDNALARGRTDAG